jgi:yeast amino acid transporter
MNPRFVVRLANEDLGMLTWIGILASHVGFLKATRVQDISLDRFPYRSPFGLAGSYIALAFLSLFIITKSFEVFVGHFDYKNFIVGYIGIPVYLTCLIGYKVSRKTKMVKPFEADLITGVSTATYAEELAQHEAELNAEAKDKKGVPKIIAGVYKRTLSWMF